MSDKTDNPSVNAALSLEDMRELALDLNVPGEIQGIPYYRTKSNQSFHMREDILPNPINIRSELNVSDIDSLVGYITRFAGDNGDTVVVFYSIKDCKLRAYLDYHMPDPAAGTMVASWCQHLVNFELKPTVEWESWVEKDRTWMKQGDFAEFIEDRLEDIATPDAEVLLKVAETLRVERKIKIESGKRLHDGTVQFAYEESTTNVQGGKTAGQLVVPQTFTIKVIPFMGLDGVATGARFKYRIGQDGCQMRYELTAEHKVRELRMQDVIDRLQDSLRGKQSIQYVNGWLDKLPAPIR